MLNLFENYNIKKIIQFHFYDKKYLEKENF